MIPYKIIPPLQIGPFHVNMYGIMFALGAFIAIKIAAKEARKRNAKEDVIHDIALYLLFGGIIGARLFYVLFYWPNDVSFDFFDIFKIWEGGLAFFGGIIGAIIVGYYYLRKRNLSFWAYADIFTIPLIIGHIFGRAGDYLTGGHPGKITNLPWAIYMDNALRHPVVLYEIIGLFAILGIIYLLKKKSHFDGFLFWPYITLYSIQRLFLDIFRAESTDPKFLGLTPSQYIALIIVAVSLYAIARFKYKKIQTEAV
ncbi:MAG: prolipoprotein diacylglyceryl transferase [Nanoarchaeota archaeon]